MMVRLSTYKLVLLRLKKAPQGLTAQELKADIRTRTLTDVQGNLRVMHRDAHATRLTKCRGGYPIWIHKNFPPPKASPKPKAGQKIKGRGKDRPNIGEILRVHNGILDVAWPNNKITKLNIKSLHRYKLL